VNAILAPQDGPSPRFIDFGATVTVLMPESQNGVDYRLVRFTGGVPPHPEDMATVAQDDVQSAGDVKIRGTGGPVWLPSKPLQSDTELYIRAIKDFDALPSKTDVLSVSLPVLVKPNPGLAVTSDPGPIFDFRASPTARIASAEAGVEYRAVALRVADAAYAQGAAPSAGIIAVTVPGQPDALIRLPSIAATDPLGIPPGFKEAKSWTAGSGADLRLVLTALTADSIIAVAARKTHQTPSGLVASAVWLTQMIAQLARPNPSPALSLTVTMAGAGTEGTMTVSGGQAGVFYTPRSLTAGPVALPAYVHQQSPDDETASKGIGQLKLEVDFAITREGQPPLPPVLATAPIAAGAALTISAMAA